MVQVPNQLQLRGRLALKKDERVLLLPDQIVLGVGQLRNRELAAEAALLHAEIDPLTSDGIVEIQVRALEGLEQKEPRILAVELAALQRRK